MWARSLLTRPRRSFDIVHIQGADAPVGNVVTAHCCNRAMRKAAERLNIRGSRRFNYLVGERAERLVFTSDRLGALVAVSRKVASEIADSYGVSHDLVEIIPNGVDSDRFRPRAAFREDRRKSGGLTDRFVVLFVGADYRIKGLPTLLEALRYVDATVIAITAEDRELLSLPAYLSVRDRVQIVPPNDRLADYYSIADVFCLPTRYDTFSLTALEAMASGLPVVVGRDAGITEHLIDASNGFILEDPGDVSVLAERLNSLRSLDLRKAMGERARQTAESLSWEVVTDELEQVYLRVAGNQ